MLRVKTVIVTPFEQNARIVIDEPTGTCLIIDPGGDIAQLLAAVEPHAPAEAYVLLTHAHMDHGGKAAELLQAFERAHGYRPKFVAHRNECQMRARLAEQPLIFGMAVGEYQNAPEPDVYAEDQMVLRLGSTCCTLYHTPGHSPGHVVAYIADAEYLIEETPWESAARASGPLLFAGDVLFAGSVGRTDLPGGSFESLMQSIKDKLFRLPDHTVVLPGHGPRTTLEREKRTNPFLKEIAGS